MGQSHTWTIPIQVTVSVGETTTVAAAAVSENPSEKTGT